MSARFYLQKVKELVISALGNFLITNYTRAIYSIFLARLLLAYMVPITSDEAYFYQWGKLLQPAYYDHSLMTGLWVKLGLIFGDHIFYPRFISILSQLVVVLGVAKLLREFKIEEYVWKGISLALWIAPIHFLFVLVVTDSPLYFFTFLSGVGFIVGFKKDSLVALLVSGIFLGVGMFSKYLIAFWILAIATTVFFSPHKKRGALYLLAGLCGFLPFAFANVLIAKDYCWWPLQFNIANRTMGKGADISFVGLFFIYQILIITPWLLKMMWDERQKLLAISQRDKSPSFLLFIFALVYLGLFSIYDSGLHYSLAFFPFLYLSLYVLPIAKIKRLVGFSSLASGILFALVMAVFLLPPETFKNVSGYSDYVIGRYGDEVHSKVIESVPTDASTVFGGFAYSIAAEFSYHAGTRYIVFGNHGKHGRNDDYWTDFRGLENKKMVLVSGSPFSGRKLKEFQELFSETEVKEIIVRGSPFFILIGQNFSFEKYKEIHLVRTRDQYFKFLEALPVGRCFFYDRYFSN